MAADDMNLQFNDSSLDVVGEKNGFDSRHQIHHQYIQQLIWCQ